MALATQPSQIEMSNSYLNEIKDLFNSYKKGKHMEKKLCEFKQLLENEVKIVKDVELISESKRKIYQDHASQQQEVLLKLLNVKGENTKLKQNLANLESKLTEIQNKRMADYVSKDTEIDTIKQDFLSELLKIREATDNKSKILKINSNPMLVELKSAISEKEAEVDEQASKIRALQEEIDVLKEKNALNSEIYLQKIAEQRREHLAELETWKIAELNQIVTGRVSCDQAGRVSGDQSVRVPFDQIGRVPNDQGQNDQTGRRPYDQAVRVPYEQAGRVPYEQAGIVPYEQAGRVPYEQAGRVLYEQAGRVPYEQAGRVPYYEQAGRVPYEQAVRVPYEQAGRVPCEQGGRVPCDQVGGVPYAHTAGNVDKYEPNRIVGLHTRYLAEPAFTGVYFQNRRAVSIYRQNPLIPQRRPGPILASGLGPVGRPRLQQPPQEEVNRPHSDGNGSDLKSHV